jgi:RecB family endonuclease NucS
LQQAVAATKSLDDNKHADYIRKSTFKTLVGDVKFGRQGEWAESRVLEIQFQHISVKKNQGVSKAELKEFREMIVSETRIEDYLEENLDYIGKPTSYDLVLIGRQFSTGVGPIDLLCKDKKNGDYLVVELKKGRSADKVYGQCSRYMGWVRKNLAEPEGVKVHGAIVARNIDAKLKAARDGHDTKVALIEFSMKFHAGVV